MTAFSVEIPGFVLASLVLVMLAVSAGCLAALTGIGANRSRWHRCLAPILNPRPQWIRVGSIPPLCHSADWSERDRFVKAEIDRG